MSSTGSFRASNAEYVPDLQTGKQAIIEVADIVQGGLVLSKNSNRFC
jgi:hypothetical protein